MRVRMLVTLLASDDGIRLRSYDAGAVYDMRESLARPLLAMGHGERCNIKPMELSMDRYPTRLLVLVTPPAAEPLTLAEAKLYLRVDGTDEDALITDLITAARMAGEKALRRSLITQAWKLAYDCEAPLRVPLPLGPVQAIASVTQITREGSETVMDPEAYTLNAAQDALLFDSPPIAFRLEIVYTAGYGSNAADVPRPLKQGMLAHIALLYDNREQGGGSLPPATLALYEPFRGVSL
jgi:uncharacterized phiE125 gp8 family phage protein